MITRNNDNDEKLNRSAVVFIDSDLEGDPDTRIIVTGWTIFAFRGLVNWGSRRQRIVMISLSTEEYVAITEATKEILYVKHLNDFMGMFF